VNQDRHQANQNQDEEPQDPWLANFNARRTAMDKKLDDLHARLEASIGDSHATLNERVDDLSAVMKDSHARLNARLKQFISSFGNSAR
jgi:hypothetical protein